ncbi:hypothetical protein [Streptomyces sp. CO7]
MHNRAIMTIAALSLAALTACGGGSSTPAEEAKPAPKRLSAEQAAEKLADATGVTTLGEPQDNTGACSNKAKGDEPHENDCVQLITTDTVSIYEFETAKVADHWAKSMKRLDFRAVGRFALAFNSRDQKLTSDERRDELEAALKKIAD